VTQPIYDAKNDGRAKNLFGNLCWRNG